MPSSQNNAIYLEIYYRLVKGGPKGSIFVRAPLRAFQVHYLTFHRLHLPRFYGDRKVARQREVLPIHCKKIRVTQCQNGDLTIFICHFPRLLVKNSPQELLNYAFSI